MIGAFIGGALIAGLIVFFWQRSNVNEANQQAVELGQALLDQLDDDHQIPEDPEPEPIATTTKTQDDRTLLEPSSGRNYNPDEFTNDNTDSCFVDFNQDAASTTVTYESSARGLQLDLPHNPDWGTDEYRINPYDEISGSLFDGSSPALLYGPLLSGVEGCGWIRDTRIEFLEARSVAEAKQAAQDSGNLEFPTTDLESVTIGGHTVVLYRYEHGFCEDFTYEVIGEEQNYQIGGCHLGEQTPEEIIESMEFI